MYIHYTRTHSCHWWHTRLAFNKENKNTPHTAASSSLVCVFFPACHTTAIKSRMNEWKHCVLCTYKYMSFVKRQKSTHRLKVLRIFFFASSFLLRRPLVHTFCVFAFARIPMNSYTNYYFRYLFMRDFCFLFTRCFACFWFCLFTNEFKNKYLHAMPLLSPKWEKSIEFVSIAFKNLLLLCCCCCFFIDDILREILNTLKKIDM